MRDLTFPSTNNTIDAIVLTVSQSVRLVRRQTQRRFSFSADDERRSRGSEYVCELHRQIGTSRQNVETLFWIVRPSFAEWTWKTARRWRTIAARKPISLRSFSNQISRHLEILQTGIGLDLDLRRSRSRQRHERLVAIDARWTIFHQTRLGLFRCQWRNRWREFGEFWTVWYLLNDVLRLRFRSKNSPLKCKYLKRVVSTDFKSPLKIFTRKCTVCSSIRTSKIHVNGTCLSLRFHVDVWRFSDMLFNAIATLPYVKKKADWAIRWINNATPFAERLVAFACVEGIFFSGSFASIFWLRERGVMPGLTFSNEMISRDEVGRSLPLSSKLRISIVSIGFAHGLRLSLVWTHCSQTQCGTYWRNLTWSCRHWNRISHRCSAMFADRNECHGHGTIHQIRCWSTSGRIGLFEGKFRRSAAASNANSSRRFQIYHCDCPFDFMNNISITGKTNFFEKRVGDYQRAGVMAAITEHKLTLDADF